MDGTHIIIQRPPGEQDPDVLNSKRYNGASVQVDLLLKIILFWLLNMTL